MPRSDRPRPAERSDQERARAREERARRRAGLPASHDAPEPAQRPDQDAARGPGVALPEPQVAESQSWHEAPAEQRKAASRTPAPGAGSSGRVARGRRSAPAGARLTRARAGALLALAAAVAAVWFLVSLFQPFAGPGHGRVIVDIPRGASSSKVGSVLAHDGVVASGFFFEVRVLLEGKQGRLHSGVFALKHDMSYSAAISALSSPPPPAVAVKVVIPEGYTRQQIAALAEEDGLSGSYLAASRRSPLLDPVRYGAPPKSGLEGFLFPATYALSAGEPAERLVQQQLRAFMLSFGPELEHRAHLLGVTPYQLLTIGSMIEREAQVARDRPLIAAVIYNRLHLGMPLGIDATIYYALAQREGLGVYGHELTATQLRLDSPYNTRLHAGLPPTPIANPGLASIEAAAHPAHVSYLYYVAAPDGCGEHVFSSSYAQFERDAAAYQAAVRRNGGQLPTCNKR